MRQLSLRKFRRSQNSSQAASFFRARKRSLYSHYVVSNNYSALLLAFENGSKGTCGDMSVCDISQATEAVNSLIDDIVKHVADIDENFGAPEELSVPPFVIFLVYKAAVITTGKVQNGIEGNLQKLRILRKALTSTAQRWLAGGENLCYILRINA